jgi:hypothetical protein
MVKITLSLLLLILLLLLCTRGLPVVLKTLVVSRAVLCGAVPHRVRQSWWIPRLAAHTKPCSRSPRRLRDLRGRNRLIIDRVGRTGIPEEEVLWTSRVFGNFIFIILLIFFHVRPSFVAQTIGMRARVVSRPWEVCWFYYGKTFRIVFIARSTVSSFKTHVFRTGCCGVRYLDYRRIMDH